MFQRRLLIFFCFVLFALSTAWAQDDIQIEDEAAPTPMVTPAPKVNVPKPTATPVKAKATPTPIPQKVKTEEPTPVPTEDEGYIQEDRTLRGTDWKKRLNALDKPLMIFTLDALYSKPFDNSAFTKNYTSGFGGDLRGEVQFYRWISLGLYYDFVDFTGPGAITGSLGMFGRIIPVHRGSLDIYAIGGLGINTLLQSDPTYYPGNFHGFAGMGFKTTFNENWGFDANVVYNYYSPQDNPLNTLALRAGLSYAVDLQAFVTSLTGSSSPAPGNTNTREPE